MNDHDREFALIDRLASGDLEESRRQDVFVWLDDDPTRWRRCALALLEARELEQALDNWRAEVGPAALERATLPARRPFRASAALALAASLMIAFSLGALVRGFSATSAPAVAELPKTTHDKAAPDAVPHKQPDSIVEQPVGPEDAPVKAVVSTANEPQGDVIPAYVRSQLERQGYQLRSYPARWPVVLPDGRRGTVAVDELQVSYVGQRTY